MNIQTQGRDNNFSGYQNYTASIIHKYGNPTAAAAPAISNSHKPVEISSIIKNKDIFLKAQQNATNPHTKQDWFSKAQDSPKPAPPPKKLKNGLTHE